MVRFTSANKPATGNARITQIAWKRQNENEANDRGSQRWMAYPVSLGGSGFTKQPSDRREQ